MIRLAIAAAAGAATAFLAGFVTGALFEALDWIEWEDER